MVELQRYIGMVNFYYRYIPRLSQLMSPLSRATSGKKNNKITWTKPMQNAFRDNKAAPCRATHLVYPDSTAPIAHTTDASDVGIGAVLEQHVNNAWQPLAFFSKSFSSAESRYSAFDKELLAIHAAIHHFSAFLEGREFRVFTDHKLLVKALHMATPPQSSRQARHLSAIVEHTADIRHVKGKANLVTDALSRVNAVDANNVGVEEGNRRLQFNPALFPVFPEQLP